MLVALRESGLGRRAMRADHEPGRASLLASRVMVDGTAARQEPRPTGTRFMERPAALFAADAREEWTRRGTREDLDEFVPYVPEVGPPALGPCRADSARPTTRLHAGHAR